MITKEQFILALNGHKFQTEQLTKLEDFGINLWDSTIIEFGFSMFDTLINATFDKEGQDWIFWYLFEKEKYDLEAFHENGEKIKLETIEDLWELVKDYRTVDIK